MNCETCKFWANRDLGKFGPCRHGTCTVDEEGRVTNKDQGCEKHVEKNTAQEGEQKEAGSDSSGEPKAGTQSTIP